MVILPAKVLREDESLIHENIHDGFLEQEFVSRLYPKQEHNQRELQSTRVQCASNMVQNMAWYAGCDMRCICILQKEKTERGLNLANQEHHWKDEMISVEIDIKITVNRCTVCKWQAKQIWHRSAIISKWSSKCIKINMLKHSNMATKYMAGIHSWFLTKDEHWATANSLINRFKQGWQKSKW